MRRRSYGAVWQQYQAALAFSSEPKLLSFPLEIPSQDILQFPYLLPTKKLSHNPLNETLFGTALSHRLKKIHLVFVWNRECSDDDPRIRRKAMKLFQRTQKEMEITARKLIDVFLANFF